MGRITSGGFIRIFLVITVLAGALGLQSQAKYSFSKREKAFYADPNVINFVRPGLVFKVSSASIAKNDSISRYYRQI